MIRHTLALFVCFACVGTQGATSLPLDQALNNKIRQCLESAPDSHDTQTWTLEEECKSLFDALSLIQTELRIEPESITGEGLQDLDSYTRLGHRTDFRFERRALDQILTEISVAPEVEPGYWDRFVAWLKEKLKNDQEESQWLLDFLDRIVVPEEVRNLMFYGIFGLVILVAVGIIVNELRAAGIFRPRRERKSTAPTTAPSIHGEDRRLTMDEIVGLPDKLQAGALLKLVIETLSERGVLPEGRGSTNRELAGLLRTKAATVGGRFDALVNVVENIVYGDRTPSNEEREKLRHDVHWILNDPNDSMSPARIADR